MSLYPQVACCASACVSPPVPCCPPCAPPQPTPVPCLLSLCAPTGPTGSSGEANATIASAAYYSAVAKAIPLTPATTQIVFNQSMASTTPTIFSTSTGYATVIQAGLYLVGPVVDVLFISAGSASQDIVTVTLLRNSTAVRSLFVAAPITTPTAIPRATVSCSTVLSLSAGDVVSVQCSSVAAKSQLPPALVPNFYTSFSMTALF